MSREHMACAFVLDGHTAKRVSSFEEWCEAAHARRETIRVSGVDPWRVARTTVGDGIDVSTVFLGIDHTLGAGPPMIYETMIFGGPYAEYCERYSTWEEAHAGHTKAVQIALGTTTED